MIMPIFLTFKFDFIVMEIGIELDEIILANVRAHISPPNPIIDKSVLEPQYSPPKAQVAAAEEMDSQEERPSHHSMTLFDCYDQTNAVFYKWKQQNGERGGVKYFASHFFAKYEKSQLQYMGQLDQKQLNFNSNFQSGNLLAVFKMGDRQYDLIMQNDTNSSGYTQWYNFIISNDSLRGSFTFRIVNFYKKYSLYKQGMKPLTKSLVFDKNWKRSCHGVDYYAGDIQIQGKRSKYYKCLTFKYDFIFENDSVQFCASYPYCYLALTKFIKQLNSPKLRIKYLGATPLKKIITLLQLSHPDDHSPKKAIIIMARQHAGQTSSSFIIQSIVEQLLSYTQQNQFLLAKFNFYIIPMINVDGVTVGNYRCNLYGYDINRCWHSEQSKYVPEIYCIKNQLRKIMKKEQIQIVLDLHGHSAKMNSFFFGNTFGKHNMIFPYVASKIQPFIDFGSCTFNDEEKSKAKTARVVLGNLIKETGSAFTFQVSLFGGIKKNKNHAFNLEHLEELGKSLVSAIYKTYLQIYKQQISLKESVYLKDLRKQLKKILPKLLKEEAGSDDEAQKITQQQQQAKQASKRQFANKKQENISNQLQLSRRELLLRSNVLQTEFMFIEEDYALFRQLNTNAIKKVSFRVNQTKIKQKASLSFVKMENEESNRKNYLMNKLRIFGETFVQDSFAFISNKNQGIDQQTQTALTYRPIGDSIIKNKGQLTLLGPLKEIGRHTAATQRKNLFELKNKRSIRLTKSNSSRVGNSQAILEGLLKYNKLGP